ncbi:MAG: copper amine oxidase N-terminal domain-containing protein [Clostridia bacterium]|nr:copper amine oxidase N-terminal domain-containing protein [Clostridia bacterium]
MKRVVSLVLAICVVLSCTAVFAANTEIVINGEKAVINEGMGKIVEKQERTFVPVRFLLQYLGFTVDWDEATQTVLGLNEAGDSFLAQIGNKNLFYFTGDGQDIKTIEMDVAPFIDTNEFRTYVPLRFLAEAMGYDVGWDGETETVSLTK